MKKVLVIIAFVFSSFSMIFSMTINDFIMQNQENLWELSSSDIQKKFPNSLQFTDNTKSTLRYNYKTTRQYIKFGNRNFILPEVLFYFDNDKLDSIFISIYNRGDFRTIDNAVLNRLKGENISFLKSLKAKEEEVKKRKIDNTFILSQRHFAENIDFVLKLGATGSKIDYYSMNLYKAGKSNNVNEMLKTNVKRGELIDNVIKSDDGTLFIEVPMVDQGQKGYCVSATLERLLRYYNAEIDQHVLAQILASEATIGTNVAKAIEILEDNKLKLRIRIRELKENDDFESYRDCQEFVNNYNKAAKRAKATEINIKQSVRRIKNDSYLNVFQLISNCRYDIFRDARCDSKAKVNSFAHDIEQNIKNGYPLPWCTFTFKSAVAGKKIGAIGLHMRIINGINNEKREIIYSDSWGKGHERKTMSFEDAWAATLYLLQVTPMIVR